MGHQEAGHPKGFVLGPLANRGGQPLGFGFRFSSELRFDARVSWGEERGIVNPDRQLDVPDEFSTYFSAAHP